MKRDETERQEIGEGEIEKEMERYKDVEEKREIKEKRKGWEMSVMKK